MCENAGKTVARPFTPAACHLKRIRFARKAKSGVSTAPRRFFHRPRPARKKKGAAIAAPRRSNCCFVSDGAAAGGAIVSFGADAAGGGEAEAMVSCVLRAHQKYATTAATMTIMATRGVLRGATGGFRAPKPFIMPS